MIHPRFPWRIVALFAALAALEARGGGFSDWTFRWEGRMPQNAYASMTYGDGAFVAVGGSSSMKSRDGANWRPLVPVNADLRDVAFGNGTFVAVGRGGAIFSLSGSSFDSDSWAEQISGVTNEFSSVAFGNGQFVAVSKDDPYQWTEQAILRSVDGKTWFRASAPPRSLVCVTYGNGRFVAVGKDTVMTSSDGITWDPTYQPTFYRVEYGSGKFVAVGIPSINISSLATSNDGITWTVQETGLPIFHDLAYAEGTFVAVSHSPRAFDSSHYIWTSSDGLNWDSVAPPGFPGAVSYGNGTWLAIGPGGFIAQSRQIQVGPRFLMNRLKKNSRGAMEIAVESPINSIIHLEAGTDLRTWTELLRATNLTGVVEFEDQSAPGRPHRFYRASEVQQ